MIINKFFVYGTLQRGMSNSIHIKNSSIAWCRKATTVGELYAVKSVNFPAMILGETQNDIVHGEIYSIKDEFLQETIENCDRLEGHPNMYRRTIVQVKDEFGSWHHAYAYLFMMNKYLGKRVDSGIFKETLKR